MTKPNYETNTTTIAKPEIPLLRGAGVCYSKGLTSHQTRSFLDDKVNSKQKAPRLRQEGVRGGWTTATIKL